MKMVYNTVIFSIYFYVLFSLEVTCIILREANVREIVIGLDEDSPVWGRGGLSNTILQINSLLNFCIQQRCDVRLNNVVPARHGWKARTNYRGGRNNPRGGSCGALCGPWMWSPSVTWRADAAKDPPDNRRVYEMGELSLNRGYNNIRDATYIPSSFDVCTSAKKTTRTSLCAMRTCCWPGQLQLVGFDDDDRLVIAHDTINSARDGEGRNIDVSSPKERTRAVGEQSSEVRVLIEGQDNWYGKKKILPLCLDYNFLRTENFFRTLFWSKMDPSDPEAIILNAWTRKYHSNWSASIEQGKSCTHTIVAHIRAGDVWGSNRNGQKIHPGKKREKRTTMKYLVRALRYVKDKLEQQLRKEKGHDAEERTEEEDEEEEEEERTEEEEEEEEVVVDHKRREREKEKSSVEYKGERISIIEHVHNDFDRISSSSHRDMRGHEPIHNNSPSVKRTKSSEIMKQRKAFTDTQSVKARNRGKMKNGSRKESRACLHFVTQFSDGSTVRERAFVHEESVLSFIHTALIESQWWIPLDTSLDKESMADVTKHERDALKQCSEGRCVSFDDVFVHAEGQARRWSGRMKGFGPLRSLSKNASKDNTIFKSIIGTPSGAFNAMIQADILIASSGFSQLAAMIRRSGFTVLENRSIDSSGRAEGWWRTNKTIRPQRFTTRDDTKKDGERGKIDLEPRRVIMNAKQAWNKRVHARTNDEATMDGWRKRKTETKKKRRNHFGVLKSKSYRFVNPFSPVHFISTLVD